MPGTACGQEIIMLLQQQPAPTATALLPVALHITGTVSITAVYGHHLGYVFSTRPGLSTAGLVLP